MNDPIIYLVKVTVAIAAFYLVYYVFLKNETYFKLNRIYLMLSIILSFLLPLFHFTDQTIVLPSNISETLNTVSVFSNQPVISDTNYSLATILLLAYILFTTFFLLRFLVRIVHIVSRFLNKSKTIYYNNYRLIITHKEIPPCSFFNHIIIPEKLVDSNDLPKILSHENVHVKQYHSIDTLVAEFMSAVLWFNPFAWKIKSAIKNTHEYLADEGVIEQGFDTTGYRLLLFEHAVGFKLGLANNFNQSITLKRMLMLNKSKSSWIAKLKVLSVIPVLFFLITAFESKAGAEQVISNQNTHKEITEQPSFPGGHQALVSYLMQQIKYPAEAKEKGIQGKVFVQFVVKKDGSIANVKVNNPVNKLLDEEAIRVIKAMPNWIPGKEGDKAVDAEMTLPIDFRLK